MLTIINCLLLYILCIDIDECLSGPCPSNLICNNMDGSYICECPDGTMKNGTTCICKKMMHLRISISSLLTTPLAVS